MLLLTAPARLATLAALINACWSLFDFIHLLHFVSSSGHISYAQLVLFLFCFAVVRYLFVIWHKCQLLTKIDSKMRKEGTRLYWFFDCGKLTLFGWVSPLYIIFCFHFYWLCFDVFIFLFLCFLKTEVNCNQIMVYNLEHEKSELRVIL